jgi:hypothetical protein
MGEKAIQHALEGMDETTRKRSSSMISKVKAGERDIYC